MSLPVITDSTIDNVTNEAFKREVFPYCFSKLKELEKSNPNLLEAISVISKRLYVDHDDETNTEVREVNRLRCVAGMLIVVNMINTQLEVDQLKDMFG